MKQSAALQHFTPNRTAGLEKLARFLPHAGADYARMRNHDLGAGHHIHVSTLSPYIRHRLLTESEVLQSVLRRHSASAAEKYVQEVFWRTYWKGWLEQRPTVWDMYLADLHAALDAVQTQSGLRDAWTDACNGTTGIDAFDHWAQELVQTGYLHNHARMWFASIWVFTLRLPWELGADFFLRHLLDGDPASNTLGWRWVAGLQTRGKTYLARADNIQTFTNGRFNPTGLASFAAPLDAPEVARLPLPGDDTADSTLPTAYLLHDDDMSPGFLFDRAPAPLATAYLSTAQARSPLYIAPHVTEFVTSALHDTATRWQDRLGQASPAMTEVQTIADWARNTGARQIVTLYAPTGPNATALRQLAAMLEPDGIRLIRLRRAYDSAAWPHATAGFFKFKEKIPKLIGAVKGIGTA